MTWRNENRAIPNDVVKITPNHIISRGSDLKINGMHALVIDYVQIGIGKILRYGVWIKIN